MLHNILESILAAAQNRRANTPLVQFLGVGAQKAGTTALASFLRAHPQLLVPKSKELHFFDKAENFGKARGSYASYHRKFGWVSSGRICGEFTPSYMRVPEAPQQIAAYNPDIRLIFLLRNPADRLYSQWNMRCRRGTNRISFAEQVSIQTEPIRTMGDLSSADRFLLGPFVRGLYSLHIKRFLEHFDKSQMLFLRSEELRREPSATLRKVTEFLRIEPFNAVPKLENADGFTSQYPPMRAEDRAQLVRVFEPTIRDLEDLSQQDFAEYLIKDL